MEGHCSTGQSPQWAVVPMEEEEEYKERQCQLCFFSSRNCGKFVSQSKGQKSADPKRVTKEVKKADVFNNAV